MIFLLIIPLVTLFAAVNIFALSRPDLRWRSKRHMSRKARIDRVHIPGWLALKAEDVIERPREIKSWHLPLAIFMVSLLFLNLFLEIQSLR